MENKKISKAGPTGKKAKPKHIAMTTKRLASYYKQYKKSFIFTIILAVFASLFSTGAIFLVGYIFNMIISSEIIDDFVKIIGAFIGCCIGLMILYIINNAFYYIQNVITVKFSEDASNNMRKEVFKKLHTLPIKYFDQTPSGELMSRVSNDIDNISQLVSQYVANIFYWVFSIILTFVLMFLINYILAFITLIVIPIMVLINYLIVKKIQPYFNLQQNKIGKLNGFTEEMVSGTKIISLFEMQGPTQKAFDKINDELTKDSIIAQASSNLMMPINTFINNIAFIILAALGIWFILPINGNISYELCVLGIQFDPFSLLVIFTMFARNFTNPINQIISTISTFLFALAGAERVFEILDQKPETDDPSAKPIKNIKGKVEARNLDFGYNDNQLVLKHLNFIAQPGHSIAIVGPTGAGKTTIVNLITKFYNLTGGDLLIDDVSIKNITMESLRKNITMVLQETYLFGQSVKENIRYGRLNATDDEIYEAAKEANAHTFIMQLPHGYETVLEDNGSDLSQGQRQLLAIARSFLAKPRIVILDEATSSIDTKTELLIGEAMSKLMKDKTSFVIAHRLSTIKNADTILVLKSGEIIESGTHDQLMIDQGFYSELYNTQFKKGQAI